MTRRRWDPDAGFTSVTFMLMLMIMILAVGGISVDLWHLVAEQRRIAGIVDGAAVAAAGAVDVAAFRETPDLPPVLDASRAMARGCDYLREHGGISVCPGRDADVVVEGGTVTVTLRRDIHLTLLKLFAALDPRTDTSVVEVAASATVGIATR